MAHILTVPAQLRSAPSVEPTATPPDDYQRINANPRQFGTQVGAAVEDLGQHLSQVGKFFGQVAADDATNKWQEETNKLLYGDTNKIGTDGLPDRGYYGLSGEDAMRAMPLVQQQIADLRKKYSQGLTTGEQQLQFDGATRRQQSYLYGEIGRHYEQQFQKYQQGTNKASADLGLNWIGSHAADESQVLHGIGDLTGAYMKEAQRTYGASIGPEIVRDVQSRALRDGRFRQIEALLPIDPAAAQRVHDQNRDLLSGDQRYHALAGQIQHKTDGIAVNSAALRALGMAPALPAGVGEVSFGGAMPRRIAETAAAQSVDPTLALATAQIESSMGQNLGSRGNIFQLGENEWSAVGGGRKGDPDTDIRNGVAWLGRTQGQIEQALGRKPEPWEVYLAHQQGQAGAAALLKNPDAPAADALAPAYGGNRGKAAQAISANGGDPNAPASAFAAKWRDKFTQVAANIGRSPVMSDAAQEGGGNVVAFGDSIAAHLVRKAGTGGQESGKVGIYNSGDTAVSGFGPMGVLQVIAATPDDAIRGKNIVLSTGTSNDPENKWKDSIPMQIAALKGKGAASVTVMGVGSKYSDRNSELAQIAASSGASFAGPLRKVAGDGIHSSDPKAELAAVQQTMRPAPQAAPANGIDAGSDPSQPGAAGGPQQNRTGLPSLTQVWQSIARDPTLRDDQQRERAFNLAKSRYVAEEADAGRAERLAAAREKQLVEDRTNKIWADAYSGNPQITAQQIATDPAFNSNPERRKQMIELVQKQAEGHRIDPALSHKTEMDLLSDITAGKIIDRGPVIDAYTNGRLNDAGFNFVAKQLDDIRTPEGERLNHLVEDLIKAVKPQIDHSNPLMGKMDFSGATQLGVFAYDIRHQVQEARKAGTPIPEIASTILNPHRYIESPDLLRPYTKPLQQSLKERASALTQKPPAAPASAAPNPIATAPIPPAGATVTTAPNPFATPGVVSRQPGESLNDYVRRTGIGGVPATPGR